MKLLTGLLLATACWGQVTWGIGTSPLETCDAILADQNGSTGSVDAAKILSAASAVQAQGADVRIRIITPLTDSNLDKVEKTIEAACPSWQSGDGKNIKSNLVSILIDINNRKKGLYYGSQWKPQLDPEFQRIMNAVMSPRLRERNLPGAVVATLTEIHAALAIPVTGHAATTTIVNQASAPTDLSGVWTVLLWIIGLVALGGGVVLFLRWQEDRKVEKENAQAAQQDALMSQQVATGLYMEATTGGLAQDVLDHPDAKAALDSATQNFAQLGRGPSDPTVEGLSEGQYRGIQNAYKSVSDELRMAKGIISNARLTKIITRPDRRRQEIQERMADLNHKIQASNYPTPAVHKGMSAAPQPVQPTPPPPPPVQNTTTIVHDSGPSYPTFIPIFEPSPTVIVEPERHSYSAPEPSYRSPDPDPPSYSGGGSSDFGSSDSGSGGSSDFGSSDSGGGGSSDW